MSDTHWIGQDVMGTASSNTLALREELLAQRHRFRVAEIEERKVLVGFWIGKILADAVHLPEFPDNHRFAIVGCSKELLDAICADLCSRTKPVLCCVVRASNVHGILLGCTEPPRALGEWVMRYMEGLDPACVP